MLSKPHKKTRRGFLKWSLHCRAGPWNIPAGLWAQAQGISPKNEWFGGTGQQGPSSQNTFSSWLVKTKCSPVLEAKGGRKQKLRKRNYTTCKLAKAGSPQHSREKLELLSGWFTLVLSDVVLCYKRMPLRVRDVTRTKQIPHGRAQVIY